MHPRLYIFSLATATVLLALASPLYGGTAKSALPGTSIGMTRVLAQAPSSQNRKAQADELLQKGVQQFRSGQFREALQTYQQVLTIYQELGDRTSEAETLNNIGEVYIYLSQYPKALETLQQALIIRKEVKDRKGEGETLARMGWVYHDQKEYAKAIEFFQQSLTLARELKNRQEEGQILNNIGWSYYWMEDYSKAIDYYQQSLVIAREVQNQTLEANTLNRIGMAYYWMKDYSKAIDYYQQSLVVTRETKNQQLERSILLNLGDSYHAQKDYAKAIEFYQQSLALARQQKNQQGEAQTLNSIGWSYYWLEDYAEAIEFFQQSLKIARELKDRQEEQQALTSLGLAYQALKDYPKAIESFQQSLTIARELHDRRGERLNLINLAGVQHALGNYAKAVDYYEQSLVIAKEIGDPKEEMLALYNMGFGYYWLNDYAKAIDYYEQSLALSGKTRDRANILFQLGEVYHYIGDNTKAIDYYEKSLVLSQEIGERTWEASALNSLGNAYKSLGNETKARDYYQQALVISRQIKNRNAEGNALGGLASVYFNQEEYRQSIDYHEQSLAISREIGNRYNEGASLNNLGQAYLNLGNYAKAIEYHKQALAISQESGELYGEGSSFSNLGVAYFKSGNLVEAENSLRSGIKALESIRQKLGNKDDFKVSIFEAQAKIYRALEKVIIAQNKPEEALEISERGRARAFAELLASRLQVEGSTQPSNFQTQNLQPPTIEQIKQIAKTQNATLVEYSIIFDDVKTQGKFLPANLYIWVIKPTGEISFRSVEIKPLLQKLNISDLSLKDLVTSTRASICGNSCRGGLVAQQNNEVAQGQPLRELYQILIEPIADLLPTNPNDHVIFIPKDYLFLVPFVALQDASGKYLIEKHTILTAPSIQVLDLTYQQRQRIGTRQATSRQGNEVLVLGNPTMPSVPPQIGEAPQPLPPLPGAEQEAIAVADILNTKAITGKEGTKSNIVARMPSARIIHLATHGLLDDIRGLGSAIALAPDSPSSPLTRGVGGVNGLLTAEEILNLKLKAELVVLSACDTGRGRITGDGVIGLSRALISAGIPSVIVSLWSVPDAPTASLMTNFYQNLQNNPNKAQALRQAMLTTMKQHPNPKNWAAFTLIGEAE